MDNNLRGMALKASKWIKVKHLLNLKNIVSPMKYLFNSSDCRGSLFLIMQIDWSLCPSINQSDTFDQDHYHTFQHSRIYSITIGQSFSKPFTINHRFSIFSLKGTITKMITAEYFTCSFSNNWSPVNRPIR